MRQISDAAYYLYLQRGNQDGFDVQDWLRAEEQIDTMLNSGIMRPASTSTT